MTLIWAQVRSEHLLKLLEFSEFHSGDIIGWTLVFIALNLIPDYFSLLETRYVIRWMGRTQSGFKILAFLAFDVLATILIFLTGSFLLLLLVLMTFSDTTSLNITVVPFYRDLLTYGIVLSSPHKQLSVGVFFYSTFFTSVWVWLFALAWGAMKLVIRIKPGIRFLIWALPIQDYPIRSIGLVLGALACISYWVFGLAVWML